MLDVREIYGVSPWHRVDLLSEEAARIGHATHAAGQFSATPVIVTESSPDGHSSVLQPVSKLKKIDPVTGETTYEDHTPYVDTPIHFAGGGGVTATHPIAKGDEGVILHAARDFDAWRQSGGTQQPMDNGVNNSGNAIHLPGVRSDPRKLPQVSTEAHHVRSDDKKHVQETHPAQGHRTFSADPSTPPASEHFDPLSQATKFIDHTVQGASGLLGRAVDGGTTHDHGLTHDGGAFMRVANALHSVLAHPTDGASMNAANLLHQVLAHPETGALMSALNGLHKVMAHPDIGAALMGQGGASSVIAKASLALKSATGISLSCPAGGLSLPAGGVSSSSLASGAAASNVGQLGGDLAGTLPNPQVVGLSHVDAHLLPIAANDAAAAALTPPVPIGALYINTSFVQAGSYGGSSSGSGSGGSGSSSTTLPPSGVAVLCVRLA